MKRTHQGKSKVISDSLEQILTRLRRLEMDWNTKLMQQFIEQERIFKPILKSVYHFKDLVGMESQKALRENALFIQDKDKSRTLAGSGHWKIKV